MGRRGPDEWLIKFEVGGEQCYTIMRGYATSGEALQAWTDMVFADPTFTFDNGGENPIFVQTANIAGAAAYK